MRGGRKQADKKEEQNPTMERVHRQVLLATALSGIHG